MSDGVWYRLECLVDRAEAADRLWDLGAAGVEVQDRDTFMEGGAIAPVPEGKTRLIAFFDLNGDDPVAYEAKVRATLDVESLRFDRYEDTSWKTAWKDYFHPVRLSDRVIVGPPWEDFAAPEGGFKIEIEPGMAFGTGTHETTQLVAQCLDDAIGDAPPERLLDVGCGSAILSMMARRLGVERVVGIDVDETAVEIAQQTIELNGIDGIDLSTRSVGAFDETFPIVLANILGYILLNIRNDLVDRTEPGGLLIVSGVTTDQAEAFDTEFGRAPLELSSTFEMGEWIALVYRRATA